MKISKAVLAAMAVAVVATTAPSCKKGTVNPEKKSTRQSTPTPDPCPGCGLG